MYILDSSAIIEIIHGSEKGKKVLDIIKSSPVATTVFSIYEVFMGVKEKYRNMTLDFFANLPILIFTRADALQSIEIDKDLERAGKKINLLDTFIAAICTINKQTLITFDNHFDNIKRLDVKIVS